MNLLRSVAMAFSMFSRLPMPRVEWKKENMRHMLSALPLVGVVIGLIMFIWLWLCQKLKLNGFVCAAGITLLPVFISGGIHMDGFMDTCDALASHAPIEKKREILKDSHAGAFAVLGCGMYLLLYAALASELEPLPNTAAVLLLVHVASRAGGALLSTALNGAKEGLLQSFKAASSKSALCAACIWLLAALAGLIHFAPIWGIGMMAAECVCLVCCAAMAKRQFGGISGDIAGFTIQLGELIMLAAYVFSQKAVALWC